ncbi:MAG: D-alanyl-D-alanine carboxypeptidase [Alphaproteobacteria bacterium]|nr:D-alanyl-D-alanine carboxypeptidase [Alphaproteobacteria bacterium]
MPYVIVAILSLFLVFSSASAHAFETLAQYAVIVDDATDTVLFEKKMDEKMQPSSMTKLMTVYIVFKRLKEGVLTMETTFPISEKAWRTQGSKMFVKVHDNVSVRELLQGIIIQSGNDACVAVAEGISGSEELFAEEMNRRAKELGMKNSHFKNASGWPAEGHVMSVHDLAILAKAITQEFPEYYPMFAEKEFTYNGIRQHNRNPLLGKNLGVDGLKTGHTEVAGYGIVISGTQDGRRVHVVLNGVNSEAIRASEAERLLKYGYQGFTNLKLTEANAEIGTAEVWFGREKQVPLVAKEPLVISVPVLEKDHVKRSIVYQGPVSAPIQQGARIAELAISIPGMPEKRIPLYAGKEVEKLSGFSKAWAVLKYKLSGAES